MSCIQSKVHMSTLKNLITLLLEKFGNKLDIHYSYHSVYVTLWQIITHTFWLYRLRQYVTALTKLWLWSGKKTRKHWNALFISSIHHLNIPARNTFFTRNKETVKDKGTFFFFFSKYNYKSYWSYIIYHKFKCNTKINLFFICTIQNIWTDLWLFILPSCESH